MTMDTAATSDRYDAATLEKVVSLLLTRGGASTINAEMVARHLVEAEFMGHASHGIRLTGMYVERLLTGEVEGATSPRIAHDAGAVVRIDGRRAFGQVVGEFAAHLGAERAKAHGISMVAVAHSGHLGRNGRWPEIAARAGIASLHFAHGRGGAAPVAPFGAREGKLRTNPIAMGAPLRPGEDLILDFAVAEVSGNTVKLALERGEKLPTACLIGPDGLPTDDPSVFQKAGALMAFGGFKGYGLAVFAEVFAGFIAGDPSDPVPTNSLLSIYFDPATLKDEATYQSGLDELFAAVRGAAPIDPDRPVVLPGDRSRALHARNSRDGIGIDAVRPVVLKVADRLGCRVQIEALLG
ncbi:MULTISPECIES: Ldh family oxidoreductase [unclassified Chelatococcus]|uniref:Ldh family oxidoreductase n=1 Tax=unclassified Chelatococcus TaxID=2638111 RepID=UPI001BCCCA9A|nr:MULTISPECIES: Ldh family oxidoreductase [unclassified Chelatococcus]CAH1670103.1 Ldh family oxidoreductase [Hyphomicrobiales bacterium]MBS7739249.1 Ldh family oxidoreductase [Chelatococcus sp. HY11]MBX3546528.1 Ldh family oxidoreductase [Chelatococcus sp.]MCO5076218.1 Ldh family oxidoreductase [Chelatococcus sp.]CAH1678459.1 Ldh family oxidoreductase [Hyphomicrobiales bacterium]